jgi:hypothetical protein
MRRRKRLIYLILCIALWSFAQTATADVRFHSDEALYSTYGRNAAVFGAWMLDGPLDKPPVSIYANALGQHFFAARITPQNVIDVPIRVGEVAAKLPNVFAGVLAVALVYGLAQTLYRRESVALVAALLMAVAPFNAAYAGSAFTDMLMLVLMLAGVMAAVRGHPGWAGVFLALSIGAKPQGAFYLPLALLGTGKLGWRAGVRLLVSLGITFGGIVLWDALRPETSLFTLGSVNISQGRTFAPVADWPDRLATWIQHGDSLLGVPVMTVVLLGLALVPLRQRRAANWILAIFCIGFFLVHWVGAFYTFDRYLLPLVPALSLLAARGITQLWGSRRVTHGAIITGILVLGLAGYHDPRADVFRTEHPDDYLHLADWLNAKPLGAILYDRWLGWEMGYYLGAWTDKRSVYYPEPDDLRQDAPRNPDPAPRYFLAPDDGQRDLDTWLDAIRAAGFQVSLAYNQGRFLVYELIPNWADPSGADASTAGSSYLAMKYTDDAGWVYQILNQPLPTDQVQGPPDSVASNRLKNHQAMPTQLPSARYYACKAHQCEPAGYRPGFAAPRRPAPRLAVVPGQPGVAEELDRPDGA